MAILLADFINPQGTRGFTTQPAKLAHNLELIKPLQENVTTQLKSRTTPFSTLTVFGRWIIVYSGDPGNPDDTIMHFVDFRIELDDSNTSGIFSAKTLDSIIKLQHQYDGAFNEKYDTVELSLAEVYEITVKPNLFACDSDEIVISKAKELGVFPIIEKLHGTDRVKVVFSDERVTENNDNILNVYAMFHFEGQEDAAENGFTYIKAHDLLNNPHLAKDLEKAVLKAGGTFDRAFFTERFDKAMLN